jgi:hypothetical protein
MAQLRSSLHQVFHAECARCGFSVDAEIRNGLGGWKDYSWEDFSKQCDYRTPAGKPTLVCPHLRAAKLKCRPTVVREEPSCHQGPGVSVKSRPTRMNRMPWTPFHPARRE